jgi:serine O-acetyltransferase
MLTHLPPGFPITRKLHACILGRITVGTGAVIGGNVWLTHDVPAGGRIAQAASRED